MNKDFEEMRERLVPGDKAVAELAELKEKCAEQKKENKSRFIIPAVCTACIAVIGVGAFALSGGIDNSEDGDLQSQSDSEKNIYKTNAEIAIIPHWEDMSSPQRYYGLEYNSQEYIINSYAPLTDEYISEEISSVTVYGYDEYAGEKKSIEGTLYTLTGFDEAAALAVRLDDGNVYPYTNHLYSPNTLGEFINALSLTENLTFNNIYYSEFDEKMNYHSYTYAPIDSNIIWDMLLSDTAAVNEGDEHYGVDLMSISIDVAGIGSKNISLAVNEDGYLQTNILATGKSFYIGKDKVQAFVDYVLENGEITKHYETVNEGNGEGNAEAETPLPEEVMVVTSKAYNPNEVTAVEGAMTPAYSPN